MARNNRKPNLTFENIEILRIAAEGKAIAKKDDLVIFVKGAVPGDIVDLKVVTKKKNYIEAIPTKFIKYSSKRAMPACEHFGVCGGCVWQNLPYSEQLVYKQQQVYDALKHIGHIDDPEVSDILGSENVFNYRNKLEFTFSSQRWLTDAEMNLSDDEKEIRGLGFHIPGKFDKVLDIEECHLMAEPCNQIRLHAREFAKKNNLEFFNLRTQEGFLRNIIVRSSINGELMVIVVFAKEDEQKRKMYLDSFLEKFKEITSLMYFINDKRNDSLEGLKAQCYFGKDHIIAKMEDLQFKVQAKSFYQTNSLQAYNLYSITREFANLTGNEIVYDLYTGTGTIANFVAKKAKKVVGVEYVEEAIEDAKVNSVLNNLDNTVFYAGDMKDVLSADFIKENGQPDVIILDPPRAGVHPDVIKTILDADAFRLVYVSCNPATQARDVEMLSSKYKIKKIQPVDMFPQTHHVENVILLEKE